MAPFEISRGFLGSIKTFSDQDTVIIKINEYF